MDKVVDHDNGGRRSCVDRRQFLYAAHIPERREGIERRSGVDRRRLRSLSDSEFSQVVS